MTIEMRVERLERAARRSKMIAVIALVFGIAVGSIGARQVKTDRFQKIVAEEIEVVDSDGNVGIRMGVGNNQSDLVVMAPDKGPEQTLKPGIRIHAWRYEEGKINMARLLMKDQLNEFSVSLDKYKGVSVSATEAGSTIWDAKRK